jgi:hypothetical protein
MLLVIAAVIVGGAASGIIPLGGTEPTQVAQVPADTDTPTVAASETLLPPTDTSAPPTDSPAPTSVPTLDAFAAAQETNAAEAATNDAAATINAVRTALFLDGLTMTATLWTATPSPTNTPVPSFTPTETPQSAILYEEDFEDGHPNDMRIIGNWDISIDESENQVLCHTPVSTEWASVVFGRSTWSDYAVEIRLKFISSENVGGWNVPEIYARLNEDLWGYRGVLNFVEAGLAYVGEGYFQYPDAWLYLGGETITASMNTWYTLRLEVMGEQIQFFVDDRLITDVADSNRATGLAGFGTAPNLEICVDNVQVRAL